MKKDEQKTSRPKRDAAAPRGRPGGPMKHRKEGAPAIDEASGGERIAKRLARAGVASRRDAEAMIAAGRVKVNGRVLASPAFNVRPSDRIEVDDAPLPEKERTRLFLFHKPAGYVTTSRDPDGRKTIFDILPKDLPRLITVGRLDINTEGLLLLTNDGGLKRVLELPSTGWLRRYRVRVHGKVDPLALAELENGIAVDGVFYGAISATMDRQQGSNAWLTLGLREGKNREVKNVLGALGLDVTRLIRISYGPFQLGELPEGAVQEIKGRMLRDQLGERLIAEAGADFDAPIARPFANKPVRAERRPADAAGEAPGGKGDSRGGKEEGRKPTPNRKREREEKREEMRGRLQTKPSPRAAEGDRAGRFGKSERPVFRAKNDRAPGAGKGERKPRSAGYEHAGRKDHSEGKERQSRSASGKSSDRPAKAERSGRPPIERPSRAAHVWMAPGARPMRKKNAEESATEGRPAPKDRTAPPRRDGRKEGGKPSGTGARPARGAAPRPGKGRKER